MKDSKLPDDLKEYISQHLYENNQEEDYTNYEFSCLHLAQRYN